MERRPRHDEAKWLRLSRQNHIYGFRGPQTSSSQNLEPEISHERWVPTNQTTSSEQTIQVHQINAKKKKH